MVQHQSDDDVTTLDRLDYILSIAGIAGAVLCTLLVIFISKPVYSNMYEDVFLRIGGNQNVWCKNNSQFISVRDVQVFSVMQEFFEARHDQ